MNLNYARNIIMNVLRQNPDMGKTAVMKVIFMLQQVKSINLGYNFSIYTYGPYSSEVTDDVDDLIAEGLIASTMYPYQNYIGYKLTVSAKGASGVGPLDDKELEAVNDILRFINGKSAKDLELYSTIIYVDTLYSKNAWEKNPQTIVEKVKEIKPHFQDDVITDAFKDLKQIDYLTA